MSHQQDQMLTAFAAAAQALASAGVRQLGALEFEDEEVGSVAVEFSRDGSVNVTLSSIDGVPIGGYSL